MAIKSFNSVGGFSVEDNTGSQVIIIDNSGNVAAAKLTVSSTSELGPAGNVKITGGTSGQMLTTDGAGNLSWTTGGGGTGFFTVYTRTGSVVIDVLYGVLSIYGRSGTINIMIT